MAGVVWWSAVSNVHAASSVLAFVTTLHCALTVLRKYRPRGNPNVVLLPSLFFVISPWILSSFLWLAIVFVTHIVWFILTDKLLPAPAVPVPVPVSQPVVPRSAPPRKGFQKLPVLAVIEETPEIRTLRFVRPDGFTFKAGQFVSVRVEIDGKPVVRCYSISSSPSVRGWLEISVRSQGKVSRFLHETVRPGGTLEISGPGGGFVYPDGERPIVLLAGGIGITPLLSMLQHAVETEPQRPVSLIFSAKSEALLPFAERLRLIGRTHARQLRLAIALSGGSERPEFFSGRIDRNLIETVVERVTESVYMLCGPQPMIEDMARLLVDLGVPKAQVHSEKFEAAVAAAAVTAEQANSFCVKFRRDARVARAGAGQTILDAAESAGLEIPSMCRGGVCGTCRVQLLQGEVDGKFDTLDAGERGEGFILACVAQPRSDCLIDV